LVALRRALTFVLLIAGCSGSRASTAGRDSAAALPQPDEPRSVPVVAFRLPRAGGELLAYRLPRLTPTDWTIGGRVSPARAAVAMDGTGRRLIYRDHAGAIDEFDLVSYRERPVAPRGAVATIASDGTVLAVTAAGTVIESEPWGSHTWPGSLGRGVRDAFAGLGSQLVVLRRAGSDSLSLATRENGVSLTAPIPDATAWSASREGDAVALATDSGLVVVEDRDPRNQWFVRLKGSPTAVAFSPSGHRIYVALRTEDRVAVVDRFSRRTRPAIPLPGPAGALRMDPWGRAILIRPLARDAGDVTWVVAVATNELEGELTTRWASDLPAVSEGGALLSRQGTAVVARDVRTLDSLGAVPGGAGDLWFVGRWKPTTGPGAARREALASASTPAARGTAVTTRPSPRPAAPAPPSAAAPSGQLWVQLSVSQNEAWASDLASDLIRAGQPARVSQPATPGAGWRVLVGPFATRDLADSAARTLGRPYWITDRGPTEPPKP
jgi:hypothetical protein